MTKKWTTIRINGEAKNWDEIDPERAKKYMEYEKKIERLQKEINTIGVKQWQLVEETRNEYIHKNDRD